MGKPSRSRAASCLLSSDLTITGPGASNLAINGNDSSRIFDVASTATVTITGLTLTNGYEGSGYAAGGAISSVGNLTLANNVISGNSVYNNVGGAINIEGGRSLPLVTRFPGTLPLIAVVAASPSGMVPPSF
jgi:hypothetical protein